MQSVTSKVKKYISDNQLLKNNARVIVGVSGGADSIALLDILYVLGYECIVAHCNFHLRGQESYRDEYFVEKVAANYNMEYLSANFDTKKYIEEELISVEMAARELRYAWFEKIRKKYDAACIAVAHHQDDSVETVLINLIRSTGIRGLTGISPINGKVIRPLLCIYRSDILEYIDAHKLEFVVDSTNKEDLYIRNKIRLNVIPLLQSINPSVVQSINKTSENLLQTEKIYNIYIDSVKQKIFNNNKISIADLLEEKEPRTILFEILFPFGFNSPTVDNIFDSIEKQSGKVFYSNNYQLIKDRDFFLVEPIENQTDITYNIFGYDDIVTKPIALNFIEIRNSSDLQIERNKNIVYIDKSKLSYPLTIRKWKQGDKFIPFGMKGHKKISDYFSDHKFSLIDKKNIWLLCTHDDIVWIIGERADNRFRITDSTTDILKIVLTKD